MSRITHKENSFEISVKPERRFVFELHTDDESDRAEYVDFGPHPVYKTIIPLPHPEQGLQFYKCSLEKVHFPRLVLDDNLAILSGHSDTICFSIEKKNHNKATLNVTYRGGKGVTNNERKKELAKITDAFLFALFLGTFVTHTPLSMNWQDSDFENNCLTS
jgi:hypothetical protein